MRLTFNFVTALCLAFALCGCGGGGSNNGAAVQNNQFAGSYSATFLRPPGARAINSTLLVVVGADGSATMVVSDAAGVSFQGTGNVTSQGNLSGSANGKNGNNGTINVSATFVAAQQPTFSGSITGAFAVPNFSGSQIAGGGSNAFAGNYSGTYSGGANGGWTATIAKDGTVTGNAAGASVTGTMSPTGSLQLSGSGTASGQDFTATWSGSFFLNGSSVNGSGIWSSSAGLNGTWTGGRG